MSWTPHAMEDMDQLTPLPPDRLVRLRTHPETHLTRPPAHKIRRPEALDPMLDAVRRAIDRGPGAAPWLS
jgi:hypothetical protein